VVCDHLYRDIGMGYNGTQIEFEKFFVLLRFR